MLAPDGYEDIGLTYWYKAKSGKFDKVGAALADRHYSRRKPGSPQFMPPGQTIVLIAKGMDAVFGWHRPHPSSGIKLMSGLDGWMCTIFRNESPHRSSDMILDAERAIVILGHDCGADGLITYVWDDRVSSVNPGYCFKKAGWSKRGRSADNRKTLLTKEVPRWQTPREPAV
jgi:hypothetical protein